MLNSAKFLVLCFLVNFTLSWGKDEFVLNIFIQILSFNRSSLWGYHAFAVFKEI